MCRAPARRRPEAPSPAQRIAALDVPATAGLRLNNRSGPDASSGTPTVSILPEAPEENTIRIRVSQSLVSGVFTARKTS